MARVTVVFGVVLMLVGIAGFVATGHTHPTALIPAYIGLVLAVCGVLAMSENVKRRKLWMHIAATVGVLGFLFTIMGAIDTVRMSGGAVFPHPIAIEEKGATCLSCLIFVLFCVRSFVQARRARLV